jgi:hypothetical protein
MGRTAGRNHHCRGNGGVFRRQKVWPAHPRKLAVQQTADHIIQPIFVRSAIGVSESDDFAVPGADAGVARGGKTEIRLVTQITNPGVSGSQLPGRIR